MHGIVTVGIILGGLGCAAADGTPPVPVGDPCLSIVLALADDASAAERSAVSAAAALWADVAATRYTVEATAGAPRLAIRFASAPLAFLGIYEPERADIIVNRDLDTDELRTIALAHELGHAMGLVHASGRPSVMNAGNISVVPNAGDAGDLALLWGACPR
jgi:hypothetical protein